MELNWKPCRVVHCYKIEDKIAHIIGFDGIIKLDESATIIWNMSNGKHSVSEILSELKRIYSDVSEDILLLDIECILTTLSSSGILIEDWDPLLKDSTALKEEFKWNN
mgnify:CR=1 FL=1